MGLLQLKIVRVPNVVGIYGKSGTVFPDRMAYLQPDAAKAYARIAADLKVSVSDMFRTAEESLRARDEKSGVQPPGYSAHNYGMAIDIATDAVLAATGFNKPMLDKEMEARGWWCHRKDGKRGSEDWHYNFLGNATEAAPFLAAAAKSTVRSAAVEAKIKAVFGDQLLLTPEEAQIALSKMKLYSGSIDGIWGGGSKQALLAFQRAWKLPTTGELDERTERTLAYVTADVVEVRPALV